ncbi:integrase family protein : Integrase OS=Knoellia subterranea KCTC 19937 GN=N803_03610 PE=4 SV=1: Phage_integrase [Gemmata massiliana]|uniref:Tyr recombinase domain-containing protein n=1 Tax=Gemmata massiliana TaxID=1210884 RepID=A0A6P2D6H3_9BACT|nr:site-specific integrase [Gemmata massiliana]VTR96066.1 integrase family protein : Integrase OS=Knoellia subterranea KCTC 19937 GN=N803_03610 PE=4 SV=1: Phage_integrase [Gemmata massiliana]
MARGKKKAARQRRHKGTGSFFLSESRGVYIGRVIVGRTPAGKPIYVERSDPTEAGLAAKLARLEPPKADATMRDWLARWLDEMGVRGRTEKIRRGAVSNYLAPSLGHLKVREVTVQQINRAATAWAEKVAPATVRLYLSVLHTAMKAAQDAGLRTDNPAGAVKKPVAPKKKIYPFTRDEVKLIVAEAAKLPRTRIVGALILLGCRMGEALALDVPAFDPITGELSITETQDHDKTRGPTKSANGVRTIDVPPDLLPILTAAIGERTSGSIFTSPEGGRSQHDSTRNAWVRVLKQVGLKYRNPHQARHTVATLLLAAGWGVGDVAAYLGDSPETIMRTYCHPTGAKMGAAFHAVLHG